MRFSLEGRYVSVRNAAQSGVVSSALIPLSSVGSVLSLDSWFSGLETSAYYSANEIHDFARRYFSHSRLDSVQGININLSPSLCNAFYDGVDINFFAPTATCQSLAYLSDVVYHEYGHMIGMSYYREHDYYFYNAALNEAFADVWALVLNDDPVVGEEYNQKNPYEFIRRYNDEPKDMSTLNGLAHHDGEIVAGALWDLYSSLGQDSAVFMPLFRSMMDGFQGLYPSGMEKEAYRAVLLDLLLADDNNGNIFDGTPHGAQIVQAFARHGIYLGEKPIMRIASEYDSSSSALSLYAKVVLSAYPLELQTKVFVYMGGLEDSSLHKIYLEKQGPGEYGLELNLNKPDVYRFIYVLEDNLGGILASDPPMAELPGDIAFYYQAHQMAVVHENSYTIDSGNEGAESSPDLVSGAWQWGETKGAMYDVGSAQSVSAPYFTPGNNDRRAWQTQIEDRDLAYPGAADVDAGYTDLILEPVHLEPGSKYVLGFDYWFHKSGENRADSTDFIEFWVRENEGPWTRLYRNHHSWAAWRAFKYALQTEDGASLSLQLKVRVQDSEGIYEYAQESVVEGAIDNFELRKASGVSVGIDRVSDVRYSGPYPNPGNDYFMVPGNKQCKVYDAQGRLVKALNQSGESVNKVSSVDWAPGIYMIHVAGETENVYKWIKKP